MWSEEELFRFYPGTYYAYTDRLDKKELPFLKRTLKRLLGLNELTTKDPMFRSPGNVLDVGCGSGWFIAGMKAQGWTVRGVEPNSAAARLGQSKFGLDIFNGTLWDAQFDSESFDYIRLNHSLEHMTDPNKVLKEVHRILAKDGKILIGVPNGKSLNARLFGSYWYHLALPVHTFVYSPETLIKMLQKNQFKAIKVIHNTNSAGIQGSLQFFLNRNDTPLRPEGRVASSQVIRVLASWAAHLENICRVSDFIEVTAVKASGV